MTLDLIELIDQRKTLQKELDEILKNRLEDIQTHLFPNSVYLTVNSNPVFYLVDSLFIHEREIHCNLIYHRFCLDLDSIPWADFEIILKELYVKYGLSISIYFKDTSDNNLFRYYHR